MIWARLGPKPGNPKEIEEEGVVGQHPGAELDLRQIPGTLGVPRGGRNDEQGATEAPRKTRGRSGAAFDRRLDDHSQLRHRREYPVSLWKRGEGRVLRWLKRGNQRPAGANDFLVQGTVFGRVAMLESSSNDGYGGAACVERTAMSGGIDAKRAARPYRYPPACKTKREIVGVGGRVARGVACSHHGDGRARQEVPSHAQRIGRRRKLAKGAGVIAIENAVHVHPGHVAHRPGHPAGCGPRLPQRKCNNARAPTRGDARASRRA
jgi:hypothetical protein